MVGGGHRAAPGGASCVLGEDGLQRWDLLLHPDAGNKAEGAS